MSFSVFITRSRPVMVALLLLASASLRAQQPPPSPLTLDDALRRAIQQNPTLAAQSYQERAAEALIEQAGLRPNPTLDVTLENFAGTGSVRGIQSVETTVQASQTLERGKKRAKRVALAGREREAAAQEFAVRRNEVLAATAVAYLETLVAQQRLALAAEPLRLAQETVAVVDTRVEIGAASTAESARARAALASAGIEHARAEAALATARAALAATWGGQPEEVSSVVGSWHLPASLPERDSLLTRLSSHPRFAWQRSVIEARRAGLELEQALATQDITVGGGLRFLREGNDAALVAGVSIPMPVHSRNQGNIRAARETLAGAEQTSRAIEVELRATFTAAWQELTSAHQSARSLRQQALPATEEAYASVRHAYEQGQLPLIDVFDAQRALIAVRRDILDAESAYALALVRLAALTDASFGAVSTLISQP